jgi:hypothetical protein
MVDFDRLLRLRQRTTLSLLKQLSPYLYFIFVYDHEIKIGSLIFWVFYRFRFDHNLFTICLALVSKILTGLPLKAPVSCKNPPSGGGLIFLAYTFSDVLYVDSRVVTFWHFKAVIRFQGFGRLLLSTIVLADCLCKSLPSHKKSSI